MFSVSMPFMGHESIKLSIIFQNIHWDVWPSTMYLSLDRILIRSDNKDISEVEGLWLKPLSSIDAWHTQRSSVSYVVCFMLEVAVAVLIVVMSFWASRLWSLCDRLCRACRLYLYVSNSHILEDSHPNKNVVASCLLFLVQTCVFTSFSLDAKNWGSIEDLSIWWDHHKAV